MSDLDIYRQWRASYEAVMARQLHGGLDEGQADRCIATMEERLGMHRWSNPRWTAAMAQYAREVKV
jgi:hypothetical protein